MDDLTLDEALDVEENFYAEGYRDGKEQSAKEQFLEGKVYGLQTGFQRFLLIGYIQGLIEEWRKDERPGISNHLDQLEKLVSEVPLTNGDAEVEIYEKAVLKARNKVRVIATITKTSNRVLGLDNLIKQVGGSLQVSENLDDMW
ncbi:CIC11C00000005112 [Sungouiella intermedia]|uniref:CIC11C00000005112 n=1 Tax=Sungouiella intermedia TaxID=45354 RepID=A0A1L0BBR7_9ASCO|nr:CIC11C00000005112 [[Candida] intermedia]